MDLERLFYPRSIAVVGASATLSGGKLPYYHILKMSGYKGNLYPVNPARDEIDGQRVYHSVDELPGDIDLAIVSVPARLALDIMKKAADKGVRFVHFFTSGFGEIGNKALEQELLKIARESNTRIVGPNCIGVYCSESRVSFDPTVNQDTAGSVAFFGQSGGVTSNFTHVAKARHIGINKAISYGNQIDLKVHDYIDYFARDDNIKVIAGYIEDVKDGQSFMQSLRRATREKPVFILKGGITDKGADAARSHTGAISTQYDFFSAAVRQSGGVLVDTFEDLANVVMLAAGEKRPEGARVGFIGAGGGASVTFADIATLNGLSMPELQQDTQSAIAGSVSDVNTSAKNPVDLGAFGFDFRIVARAMEAMDKDKGIDIVIPYFSIDFIAVFQKKQIKIGPEIICNTARNMDKPVAVILSRLAEDNIDIEKTRIEISEIFRGAGIPVYNTIQDVVYSIKKYLEYLERLPRLKA